MNVLLDLDGTLTDPREGIVACLKHALEALGCCIPADSELEDCIGPPLHASFARLLGPDMQDCVQEALKLYRQRFAASGMYENAVYPGVREALAGLSSLGASLHLATSKPRVFAERILDHFRLASFFSSIHGSELDGTRSDKAELIAHLLKVEPLHAGDTFMVGDRAHDVIGAKANGVFPVGVLWGYGTREELISAGVGALCERPHDFVQLIALLGRTRTANANVGGPS